MAGDHRALMKTGVYCAAMAAATTRVRSVGASMQRRICALRLAIAVPLLFGTLAALPTAAGATSGTTTISASVNGQALSRSSQLHPVHPVPARPADVDLRIFNSRARPVNIRTVELQGRVVGLTFFAFETSVGLKVRAHSSTTLHYVLDLSGLKGQATGLIPGSLSILDANGNVVASVGMVSNVQGSIVSVYGLFGLGLLILTVLALLSVLLSVARHKLPANRFRRALRFLAPGIGVGLVIVFTLSAFRIWIPTNKLWLGAILIAAATSFMLGYLTPTPAGSDDEDEDDEDDGNEDGPAPAAGTAAATVTGNVSLPPP